MRDNLLAITEVLLQNPTAPFRETLVREHILRFCEQRNIKTSVDEVGNVIATYGSKYKNQVLAFEAHMDHPGFIIEADSVRNRTTALFYGGVDECYFKGSAVKVFTADGPVKGVVTKTNFNLKERYRQTTLKLEGPVKKGDTAMWDLPVFRVRGDNLYTRSCDDVVGCAAVLTLLDELTRRKTNKKVTAIFTCAEEAGCHGAKFLCMNKAVPRSTCLIAIETSPTLPTAPVGDGVVIRVGDRLSIFTPAVTQFLIDQANTLKTDDESFKFQRKLMDGGVCESTVYNMFGYTNGAVCVPLGNYHNRNTKTGKIDTEFVSISDLENMVKLFLQLINDCDNLKKYTKQTPPAYKLKKGKLGEFFLK